MAAINPISPHRLASGIQIPFWRFADGTLPRPRAE
jgi:hypothetical protein